MKTIEIKTDFSGEELQQFIWDLEAFTDSYCLPKPVLRQTNVSGTLPLAPTDDEIEENGKKGGLRDGELQMFWEGAVWMRSKAQWKQ